MNGPVFSTPTGPESGTLGVENERAGRGILDTLSGAGHFLIGLALVGAAATIVCARLRRRWTGPTLAITAAAALTAVAVLSTALVRSDPELAYVAEHTRRAASGPYRLAGLWGGMAGSLLLWSAMVALLGAVAARTAAARMAVAGLTAALLGIVWAFADPFTTLAIPAIDGQGLTPILEHPAMLYHPPLVYLGLTVLVAPFVLTLSSRTLDDRWRAATTRWMLAAWVLLTIAMVAGAHWAYVELGWGGFWAWDPVENTSLLPWLAATAFLHTIRRPGHRRIAAALAMTAGVLAMLGTLLTRSGAVDSVHAFAEDSAVGWSLVAIVASAVAATIWTVARVDAEPPHRPTASARALDAHALLVGFVLIVVLIGSTYPLIRHVTVPGRFFTTLVAPVAVVLLILSAIGPRLGHGLRLRVPAVAATVAMLTATLAGGWTIASTAIAAAGAFAASAAVTDLARTRKPGHLAHLGLAIFLVGAAGSATGSDGTVFLAQGETARVAGYDVTNNGVSTEPNRVVANISVGGTDLRPSLDAYPARNVLLAETSLHSTPARDVQVILRDAHDDGHILISVYVRPLMQLVWWGGLVLAAAGAWRLVSRRPDPGSRASWPAADRSSPAERPPSEPSEQEPVLA